MLFGVWRCGTYTKNHDHSRCGLSTRNSRTGHRLPSFWLTKSNIDCKVILAECTGCTGNDPGPLAPHHVNEKGVENDGTTSFDEPINTRPQSDIGQTNRCEDRRAVVIYSGRFFRQNKVN